MMTMSPGYSGSIVIMEDGPSRNFLEASRFRMYLMWKDVRLMYLSPPGNDYYLVVTQSQLGEAW
jgi:hypothetical protein